VSITSSSTVPKASLITLFQVMVYEVAGAFSRVDPERRIVQQARPVASTKSEWGWVSLMAAPPPPHSA